MHKYEDHNLYIFVIKLQNGSIRWVGNVASLVNMYIILAV